MKISNLLARIKHNFPAKVLSLTLAILLYLSNQMLSLETKDLAIPISIQETGEMVITNTIPQAVQVEVRSNSENVSTILQSDISLQLDTTQYFKSGKYEIPLDLILSPDLVTIKPLEIDINPKTITVYLERRVAKWIPLVPDYTGDCAHGYEISDIQFTPAEVRVSGSEINLDSISSLKADKITLTNKKESFTTETYIQNFSNALTIETPKTIMATVSINEIYETKTFYNIPIQTGILKENLKITNELPAVSIALYGTQLDLESYKSSLINVHAVLSQINEVGEYDIPLRVFVSQRFELKDIDISKIHIVVESIETTTEKIDDNENITNVTPEILEESSTEE